MTLAGSARFQTRGRLGHGGGGVVYRAHDRVLERDVAVKLMNAEEGSALARFRSSFASLRQLAHPNLVKLYDLVEEGGHTLLVMELVEGVELLEHVRKPQGGFHELRLRAAFSQLAQGLRALHHEGKVHRDVKPSNARVTADGRVVLLDLDLALDQEDELREGELDDGARPVGTAMYMAPEQVAAHGATAASDWYSVGVVLYEALTGTLPYRGADLEVLLAKQDGRAAPPSKLAPNVPPDLDALCLELLSADPAERPDGLQVLRRLGVHEEIVSGRLSLASLLPARTPFTGREHELERLSGALERSRNGAVVVRITGEAGSGKTTLGHEFMRRRAHDLGRTFALSSSCPRYPDRPHAALHEPIARLAETLRERESSLKLPISAGALRLLERAFEGSVWGLEARSQGRTAIAPDRVEQRWRAISALRAIVSDVAQEQPLVWWMDDYHWADVDTQRLVSALVAGPDAPRMLLVLSEEHDLGTLPSAQPAAHEVIALTRLTQREARTLAEGMLERATGTGDDVESVFYRDGLPLMIEERLHHALFFGEGPSEQATLSQLIVRRARELPKSALALLEIVCVAHDPLPQETCERASELPRAEFARQLSALRVGGLVKSLMLGGEDQLAPGHPLIAECIAQQLDSERRRTVHTRIASALLARDPERASGRLLRHQGETGDLAAAAESALVSAEQAHGALAFQRAAELFTLAATLDPPAESERGHARLKRMADALADAGWSLQAATIYREAALAASAVDALHMRQRAMEHLVRAAEVAQALDALREMLVDIDASLPETRAGARWSLMEARARLSVRGLGFKEAAPGQVSARDLARIDVLWTGGTQLMLVDPLRGSDLLTRSLIEALRAGEPERIARGLCSEALLQSFKQSKPGRAEEVLNLARTLVERLDSPLLDGHMRLSQGVAAFSAFRMSECATYCRDAERVFRDHCVDAPRELSTAQTYQTLALAHLCRNDELEPKLERFLREASERGDVWGSAYLTTVGAMSLKLAKNLPNEAAEDVKQALQRWEAQGVFHFQHLLGLIASAYIDLYRDKDTSLELLEARWPEVKATKLMRLGFVRLTLLELRARARIVASRKRRDPALLSAARADARTLARGREPGSVGLAHMLNANVALCQGELTRAVEQLERGLVQLEPHGLLLWVTPARVVLGELVGGDRGQALKKRALDELGRHGVVDKERFVDTLMPGFVQLRGRESS